MHDGIQVESSGIPSATICTDRFEITARAMASLWGAPDYPTIYTPHPIGGLDKESVRRRAEELVDQAVAVLTGVEASQLAATL